MRLSIQRAELARLLSAVDRVVEARTTIPILSNVLLTATDGRLEARGTNLDIEATASGEAVVEVPGAITLPAKTLKEIAGKLPKDAVVTIAAEAGAATIKSSRSRFKLATLPVEDYPDLANGKFDVTFPLTVAQVKTLFGRTAYAMSTESTRYYLNGVYLHEVDGNLTAVATDGHQLARASVPAPLRSIPSAIIPTQMVAEIQRQVVDIEVSLSSSKIRIAAGDTVITSKLIDGTFPDYQRVIPTGNDKRAVLDKAEFGASVERVATVASDRSRAVKLSLASGAAVLSVRGSEGGTAEDELAIEYDSEPVEIGFNGTFIGNTLRVLDAETVEVAIGDPSAPALFSGLGDASSLHVIMPMRVS
jgi:DNA polymerase-3 subunit beta